MGNDIIITYSKNGVEHTLRVFDDDNLPYNLAEAFSCVIKDSNANEEMVIEELKNAFEYEN